MMFHLWNLPCSFSLVHYYNLWLFSRWLGLIIVKFFDAKLCLKVTVTLIMCCWCSSYFIPVINVVYSIPVSIHTLRFGQKWPVLSEYILKFISIIKDTCILLQVSLNFVLEGQIGNESALTMIVFWWKHADLVHWYIRTSYQKQGPVSI